jgi:ABC-type histidine transport system ATPase subunit
LAQLKEARLTKLRRSRMGFVFQSFNLLPSLTVEQNITLPLRLDGKPADRGWLEHVVSQVGIADKLGQFPTVSSSASLSPVPSSPGRKSSSRTSRQALWIRKRPEMSSVCYAKQ